jgi:type I restriction enzyme M protein
MRFEEFADCQAWWSDRAENERAWRVPVADLEANGYNLDLRNPNRPDDLTHRPPSELLADMVEAEKEILALLVELQAELTSEA